MCSALVLGDPGKCMGNAVCVRQVARWRTLIEKPAEHRPFPAQARVQLHGLDKTPDPAIASFELVDAARQGAVVHHIGGGRTKVTFGSAPTPSLGIEDAGAQPRLWLQFVVSPADLAQGEHPLGPGRITMDLLVPTVDKRAFSTIDDAKLTGCAIGTEIGSPVKLSLSATLRQAPDKYAVTIEIETYVRDLIGDKERWSASE
jgi:hypothetical protein